MEIKIFSSLWNLEKPFPPPLSLSLCSRYLGKQEKYILEWKTIN